MMEAETKVNGAQWHQSRILLPWGVGEGRLCTLSSRETPCTAPEQVSSTSAMLSLRSQTTTGDLSGGDDKADRMRLQLHPDDDRDQLTD